MNDRISQSGNHKPECQTGQPFPFNNAANSSDSQPHQAKTAHNKNNAANRKKKFKSFRRNGI